MTEQTIATEDRAVELLRVEHKGKSYNISSELLEGFYKAAEDQMLLIESCKDALKEVVANASEDTKIPKAFFNKLFRSKFKNKIEESLAELKGLQEVMEAMDSK